MLKFLRKIRYRLMDEGRFKKYLIYAIGEILLVVIGILLALQVNNWNQNRIEEEKEHKALVDLSREFKLNQERIQVKQGLRVSIVPELDKYIEQIASGEADYEVFKNFHSNPFMFGMTNPSNGVINALISSGDIAVISNDSLKYLLADWKNQLENLYENEQILWSSGLKYIDNYAHVIPIPTQNWHDWDQEKLELAFDGLIASVAYKNNLTGFEGTNNIVIDECNTILMLMENILSFLEREISKRE